MLFNIVADNPNHLFKEDMIGLFEGGGFVTINIDLSDDPAVCIDRDDNLRLGLYGAGQVAGIGADIIDDDGPSGRDSRPANALIHWNTNMRCRFPDEGTKQQHFGVGRVQHIETNPMKVR